MMDVVVRAIAYTRVSTEEQAASGLGLQSQNEKVTGEIARRGWDVTEVLTDDGYSAKSLDRPAIAKALEMLAKGEADALVVAKLDRLSRSLLDFAGLMDRSSREGWSLVALDLGVDTSTPAGEMMASVMASFAQYERRLIGQRTKDALAALKARGVRLGRPVTLPDQVRQRIRTDRAAGLTLAGITEALNTENVPTAQGGSQWYPSSVAAVLRSVSVDSEIAAVQAVLVS